jgi:Domain of unknown function (DUF4091)
MCTARYGESCFTASGATEADGWRLNALLARIGLDNRITIANAQYQPLNDNNVALFRESLLPLLNGTAPTRLPGARLTALSIDIDAVAAWRDEAESQGFSDLGFIYACDEPGDDSAAWDACKRTASQARAVWPDLPVLVTATIDQAEDNNALQSVNWLVCIVNFMDGKATGDANIDRYVGNQREKYDTFLASDPKNQLWLYTSCMSHGCGPAGCEQAPSTEGTTDSYFNGWPGYVIDQPPTEAVAMGWLCYLYQATGELYYATTGCFQTAWTAQYAFGGNGDGTLFYPGDPARTGFAEWIPLESLRLKRIRDGYQDWELLQIVSNAGHQADARQIASALFPTMSSANPSAGAVEDSRRELAHLADPTRVP